MTRIRFLPIWLAVLSLLAAWPLPGRAAEAPPRLVLMDLAARGVPDDVARSLTSLLSVELSRLERYTVISRQDIRSLLEAEGLRMAMGVEDPDAVRKIGQRMEAPYLIYGSIGVLGGTYVLTLSLMDTKEVKAIRRVKQTLVGQADGLAGAVRTAVLALALEESGVSHPETVDLLESLYVAERPKQVYLRLGFGYLNPIGPTTDGAGFSNIRPAPLSLRLDAEFHLLPWLRLTASSGYDRTIAGRSERRNQWAAYTADAASQTENGKELFVTYAEIPFDYSSVPLLLGFRVTPGSGRLLPFIQLSIGPSWTNLSSGDERLFRASVVEQDGAPLPCQPPFTASADGECRADFRLQPLARSMTTWNLNLAIRAGMEILLQRNLSLSFEVTYQMAAVLAGDALERLYLTEIAYDNAGQPELMRIGDSVPYPKVSHHLGVGLGAAYYW